MTGKSHPLEINLGRVNVRLQMETVCKELTLLVDISLELDVILDTHVYAILYEGHLTERSPDLNAIQSFYTSLQRDPQDFGVISSYLANLCASVELIKFDRSRVV